MKVLGTSCMAALVMLLLVGCGEDTKLTVSSNPDQTFVNDVALGGLAEVKLGELATKNGASQEVKDFGAQMVTDHGKANSDLAALAGKKGWKIPTELDSSHQKDVDKFSKLSGADFDKDYVKDMVEDHEKDVKDVKDAIPKLKDADLKTWAQGALEVMEGHLKKIQAIKK